MHGVGARRGGGPAARWRCANGPTRPRDDWGRMMTPTIRDTNLADIMPKLRAPHPDALLPTRATRYVLQRMFGSPVCAAVVDRVVACYIYDATCDLLKRH